MSPSLHAAMQVWGVFLSLSKKAIGMTTKADTAVSKATADVVKQHHHAATAAVHQTQTDFHCALYAQHASKLYPELHHREPG